MADLKAKPIDAKEVERLANNSPVEKPRLTITRTPCCGFKYVHGVHSHVRRPSFNISNLEHHKELDKHTYYLTPEDIIEQIRKDEDYSAGIFAFIIVKGYANPTIGDQLMAYIAKNNLGVMTSGDWVVNPNSNNMIMCYLWHVNQEVFLKI